MALNANALITLAQGKTFLGIPTLETSHDSLVEDFINEASQMIETYCNRFLIQRTVIEYKNGNGRKQLILNQYPISSITSLHDDLNHSYGAETLIDASNYGIYGDQLNDNFYIERFDSAFCRGQKNIKIVYVAGYLLADIPADLKLACKIIIAFYYNKQQSKDWTTSTKSKGDENITVIQGIPQSAIEILDKYKRLEILGEDEPHVGY